jgi:HEAT repeat protein
LRAPGADWLELLDGRLTGVFGAAPLPRNLDAALRDARDAKAGVRESAVRDLARHAGEQGAKVIQGLIEALADGDANVRTAAARALGDIEAREALDELIRTSDDRAAAVSEASIEALGILASPSAAVALNDGERRRARERIEQALRDKQPAVRFQALMAYPRSGASREAAVSALVEATGDADELVVHIAFRVAEELADQTNEGLDDRIVERAARALSHRAARVRAVAAVVLASAEDARGDAILAEIVSGALDTPEIEDIAAAIELAGARGLRATMGALERRAFGGFLGIGKDALSWHARTALARMGHPRAVATILGDLAALSRHTRTLAVAAAGRARLVAARPRLLAMRGLSAKADPTAVDSALREIEEASRAAAEAG